MVSRLSVAVKQRPALILSTEKNKLLGGQAVNKDKSIKTKTRQVQVGRTK